MTKNNIGRDTMKNIDEGTTKGGATSPPKPARKGYNAHSLLQSQAKLACRKEYLARKLYQLRHSSLPSRVSEGVSAIWQEKNHWMFCLTR